MGKGWTAEIIKWPIEKERAEKRQLSFSRGNDSDSFLESNRFVEHEMDHRGPIVGDGRM